MLTALDVSANLVTPSSVSPLLAAALKANRYSPSARLGSALHSSFSSHLCGAVLRRTLQTFRCRPRLPPRVLGLAAAASTAASAHDPAPLEHALHSNRTLTDVEVASTHAWAQLRKNRVHILHLLLC